MTEIDMHKIITSHIYPPIPDRQFDWCAYYEGHEEDGNYGYGRTEEEAIADFIENHAEEPPREANTSDHPAPMREQYEAAWHLKQSLR